MKQGGEEAPQEKCKALENIVVDVARKHQKGKEKKEEEPTQEEEAVKKLLQERKALKREDRRANCKRITEISKEIQKGLKNNLRTRKRNKVAHILREFPGVAADR